MVLNIYQEKLLEYYKNKLFKKDIEKYNLEGISYNYSCADNVNIKIYATNSIIEDIAFKGEGCIISQATTSIICKYLYKANLDNINKINKDLIIDLIKIDLGPNRLKCALIPLDAILLIKQQIEKLKLI